MFTVRCLLAVGRVRPCCAAGRRRVRALLVLTGRGEPLVRARGAGAARRLAVVGLFAGVPRALRADEARRIGRTGHVQLIGVEAFAGRRRRAVAPSTPSTVAIASPSAVAARAAARRVHDRGGTSDCRRKNHGYCRCPECFHDKTSLPHEVRDEAPEQLPSQPFKTRAPSGWSESGRREPRSSLRR